jgi:hypothetical protein
MYSGRVKAVTITMPEELDRRAADEARRRGISKSELIRLGLAAVLPSDVAVESAPENLLVALAGFGPRGVSIEPDEIDDIIYGT